MKKETIYVAAAIIGKDGCILAAQRGYGDFKGKWEFPGGKIKDGETSKGAVIREIKEELNADLDYVSPYMNVKYDYPDFVLDMDVYLCTLKNDINFVYHDNNHLEHDNLIWLELEDLEELDWLPADIKVVEALKETVGYRYFPSKKKINVPTKNDIVEYDEEDGIELPLNDEEYWEGVEEDEVIVRHRK